MYSVSELSTRFTALLLAVNMKASWNKARTRCKHCACHWTIWVYHTETGTWPPLKHNHNKRW